MVARIQLAWLGIFLYSSIAAAFLDQMAGRSIPTGIILSIQSMVDVLGTIIVLLLDSRPSASPAEQIGKKTVPPRANTLTAWLLHLRWNPPSSWSLSHIGWVFIPIAACNLMSRYLNVLSYSLTSLSMSELAKSSELLFSGCLSVVLFHERLSLLQLCSFVPVVLGITVTSGFSAEFEGLGCSVAIMSSVFRVLQNMLTRWIVVHAPRYHMLDVKFIQAVSSMGIMLVWCALSYSMGITHDTSGEVVVNRAPDPLITDLWGNGDAWLSGLSFFLSSFSASALLATLGPVGYSMAVSFRRVFTVLVGMVMAHSFASHKIIGLVIAAMGLALYSAGSPNSQSQGVGSLKLAQRPHELRSNSSATTVAQDYPMYVATGESHDHQG